MLLRLTLTTYVTICIMTSYSQNIAANWSFEEYYSLPASTFDIHKCKHWYTPRGLSPDYFHREAITPEHDYTSPIVSIPNNIFGYQEARTGNAYAGIISIDCDKFTYREMISVKLTEKLKKDTIYIILFYVSLAETSMYYHNFFGITLATDSLAKVKTKLDYGKVIAQNSITVKVNTIGSDTVNWHLVTTTYKAKGGEQYLYIGSAKKNMNRFRYWTTKYFRKTGWGDEPYAYYYIDDVSVVKVKNEGVE